MSAAAKRYRVTIAFLYDLPATSLERERLYGTVDPGACVALDLDTDPIAFLADTPHEVVAVTQA